MLSIRTFQTAVYNNTPLNVFSGAEWRHYCRWAKWMLAPTWPDGPPTKHQVDELNNCIFKIKAECKRRGHRFK